MSLCVPLLLALTPGTADEDPAVAAARKREQLVRTARFEVRVREVHARGARSDRAGAAVRTPVPAAEMVVEWDGALVISGNKARVETNQPMWTGTRFGPPRQRVDVSDGDLRTTFFPDGLGPDRVPQGLVERSAGAGAADSTLWAPASMVCRGFGPDLLVRAETDEAAEVIEGDRCREYTAPGPARYWLAVDKGYVVRRIRHGGAFQTTWQTDVQYRQDDSFGWLPSDWALTEYGRDGRTLVTTTVTVAGVRLNEAVPDETFRVTFPPGTRVGDSVARKDYSVGPDGTWHEVDPAALIRFAGHPEPPGLGVWWQLALFAWLGVAVVLGVLLAI